MFRVFDIENRHTVDGCSFGRIRRRVHHVIGTNDDSDICVFEFRVDVLHLVQFIVRDIDFGEEYVHVPGHTSGDRMNGELYLFAFLLKLSHQLFDS